MCLLLGLSTVQTDLPGLISLHRLAPEFPPADTGSAGVVWVQSGPFTLAQLRGKVVLVDFWEYTCINCIRTFPANLEWYRRYHPYGFEIIGVHVPEFPAATRLANVEAAVRHFGLPYPIVVDNHFLLWKAYDVHGWPTRFLLDAHGFIRYARTGEGADASFEKAIRALLREAHPSVGLPPAWLREAEPDAFAPGCGITTPEMYVGPWFGRGVLANREGYHLGRSWDYQLPPSVADGRVVLGGRWRTEQEGMVYAGSAQPEGGEAQLRLRYHAREVYAVLNLVRGRSTRLYVQQDGHWLTSTNRGADVQFDSAGRSFLLVSEARMYYLVSNPRFETHTLSLIPASPGLMVNSFTFGNDCQLNFPHR